MAETDQHPLSGPDRWPREQTAQFGMWLFLASEVLLFGGLLLAYLYYRVQFAQAFAAASAHLDLWLGAVNTALLLTSSLSMALADHAADHGDRHALRRRLWFTALLGLLFLAVKGYEWYSEYSAGLAPLPGLAFEFAGAQPHQAEMFFNLYFAMTGVHALHLAIGIGLVIALAGYWRRAGTARVRVTALYWHLVDLVWVFLYPLLYLVR